MEHLQLLRNFYYLLPQADNIWVESGKQPIKATKIVLFTADMEVIYRAAQLYHLINKFYNFYPEIYCMDGDSFLDHVNSRQRLLCRSLGVSRNKMLGFTEHDRAYSELEESQEQVIFVMPFVYYKPIKDYIQRKYNLKALYYAPAEGPEHGLLQTMRYDNLMALMDGKYLIQEIVLLYDNANFQEMSSDTVRQLRNILRYFRGIVMVSCPMWRIRLSLWWNKKRIRQAREKLLKKYQQQLKEQGFNY